MDKDNFTLQKVYHMIMLNIFMCIDYLSITLVQQVDEFLNNLKLVLFNLTLF